MFLFFLFFRGSNIIENMVTMMEKHANHLEQLVEERTRQLNEEKEKTEKILCRLLPPYVLNLLNPSSGADPGFFFRRGCTRLLLYFNTNNPQIRGRGRLHVGDEMFSILSSAAA